MDHPNQNTMLLPASYAVISEEEMTYLDGGQSIYLGSAFNHDIYFNTDQFATFCQNAAINLFVLMTNYSFLYIAGRVQSGLSNGLSLSGTFYHTWDKMNTWSRIASVGVAGLAGVYVYSQVMNVIRTVTSIYDRSALAAVLSASPARPRALAVVRLPLSSRWQRPAMSTIRRPASTCPSAPTAASSTITTSRWHWPWVRIL